MAPPRILEVTATWLIEKFCGSTDTSESVSSVPSAESDGDTVRVTVGGRTHVLDRARAEELRNDLEDALEEQLAFVHTAGEHRRSGEYVVERRGADSAGHRKVFESFAALQRLFQRLPDTFTAEDLTRAGLTAGRRHMVLWHFVEHPAFECTLTSRQPLTVEKDGVKSMMDASAETGATEGWSD